MIGRSEPAQRTVIYRKGADYWLEPGLGLKVVRWTTDGPSATVLHWWCREEDKYGLKTIASDQYLIRGDPSDAIEQAIEKWKELQKMSLKDLA